jgi:exonuclease III
MNSSKIGQNLGIVGLLNVEFKDFKSGIKNCFYITCTQNNSGNINSVKHSTDSCHGCVFFFRIVVLFLTDNFMKHLYILISLILGGIETNPGPSASDNHNGSTRLKSNMTIRSYNCNGLGSINKFRRLLTKIREEVKKGGVVLLQETHIKDENLIKTYWKMIYVTSCVSTQSAGVIILFDNSYECLESCKDESGRMVLAVIENDIEKFIVVNVYCPCDSVLAKSFIESVYDKIYEVMDRHPDAFLILGGDLNACMTEKDFLNRNYPQSEVILMDYIKANNNTCEIVDAYRCLKSEAGYTWSRQTCQSRLDYIFISRYLATRVINVELDWALEQSDHASVLIVLGLVEEDPIGPGITRVNGQILENPSILASTRTELGMLMDQIPEDWNPHQTLEYMKVCIRSVISGLVGRNRKELKCEIEELEKSLNDMQAIKASVNSNIIMGS